MALDFFYAAPNRKAAEQLHAFLVADTGYVVNVEQQRKGLSKVWTVGGTTQPMPVSLETLNEWVRRLVATGAERGGCIFDGWGALAPS